MEQQNDRTDEATAAPEATASAERDGITTPKVWVASLSDYNAGRLVGAWVRADSEEHLWAGIQSVLASSREPNAEEWAFHDYEGFGDLRLGEYVSVESLARLGAGIVEHGVAFAHFASLVDWEDAERLEKFQEAYQGHFESLAEYGRYLVEIYDIERAIEALPELVAPYVRVDTEAFARDAELGGMIMTSEGDGGIYVFEADV